MPTASDNVASSRITGGQSVIRVREGRAASAVIWCRCHLVCHWLRELPWRFALPGKSSTMPGRPPPRTCPSPIRGTSKSMRPPTWLASHTEPPGPQPPATSSRSLLYARVSSVSRNRLTPLIQQIRAPVSGLSDLSHSAVRSFVSVRSWSHICMVAHGTLCRSAPECTRRPGWQPRRENGQEPGYGSGGVTGGQPAGPPGTGALQVHARLWPPRNAAAL